MYGREYAETDGYRDRPRRVGGKDTLLQAYLAEIRKVPLLAREEEREFALRARAGDPAARERMVRSNLRLVVSVAQKYRGRGLPLYDLVQEGNTGLLKAVERYDPSLARFSTYGTWWIRQAIRHALTNTSHTVRVPSYKREHANRAYVLARQLEHPLTRKNRAAAEEELRELLAEEDAAYHHLKRTVRTSNPAHRREIRQQMEAIRSHLSLSWNEVEDAFSHYLNKKVVELDPHETGLEDRAHRFSVDDLPASRAEHETIVREALRALPPREEYILRRRYGMPVTAELSAQIRESRPHPASLPAGAAAEPWTLTEVSREIRVTRERVRQLQEKALGRLRRIRNIGGLSD